jgi:hypothetical protein
MTLEEFLQRARRNQVLKDKGIVGTFHPIFGLRAVCRICRTRTAAGMVRFLEFGRSTGKGYCCRPCWASIRTEQERGVRFRYREGIPLTLHHRHEAKEE